MMGFTYNKVDIDSSALTAWKQLLSIEEKICFESDLSDYEWYSVSDNGYIVAVFQIIDVRDQYAKNLSVLFSPARFNRYSVERKELDYAIRIMIFIFDAIVSICSGKMRKIKFHTHDTMMNIIFSRLAESHNGVKDVKKYGKWVEVEI